jgi:outer membrane protein TolC
MRITTKRGGAWPLLAAGLLGCATTGVHRDLEHVERLSHTRLDRALFEGPVDAELAADTRSILSKPLTVDSAVRLALLNNRELRAKLRELGIARAELVQAGLLPNPIFGIELAQPVSGEGPVQTALSVELDLTDALLVSGRTDVAAAELAAERYAAAGELLELTYRVRTGFYAYQAAHQRYGIAQRMLDALAASREAARALVAAGNASELDLASQEVAYEDARATAAALELELLDGREDLQHLLGLAGEATAWSVEADLPPVPESFDVPADLERRVLDESLTLKETRRRLEAIAHRTGLARAEGLLPELAIGVHAEHGEDDWELGGGVSVAIPLFDHGQGRLGRHEAEFDALSERHHGEAIALRSAARRARNAVLSAYARARQYQDTIVPARARVMEETLLHYNAMQVGVFELLAAHRGRLDAELALASALREFWSAQAALDALRRGRAVAMLERSETTMRASSAAEGGH